MSESKPRSMRRAWRSGGSAASRRRTIITCARTSSRTSAVALVRRRGEDALQRARRPRRIGCAPVEPRRRRSPSPGAACAERRVRGELARPPGATITCWPSASAGEPGARPGAGLVEAGLAQRLQPRAGARAAGRRREDRRRSAATPRSSPVVMSNQSRWAVDSTSRSRPPGASSSRSRASGGAQILAGVHGVGRHHEVEARAAGSPASGGSSSRSSRAELDEAERRRSARAPARGTGRTRR